MSRPSDSGTASRRQFLQATATTALASKLLSPAVVHAANKGGTRLPVLGQGEHKYAAIHGWGQLPRHVQWGNTHGVCIDAEGFVYIKHQSRAKTPMDSIVVFDPAGKFVRSFGKQYHGGGHGIDVRNEDGEEFLYLSDIKNRMVVKTSLRGEEVWRKSFPKQAGVYNNAGQFRPTNVAFAPGGGFYVGDGYGSHYIHQYDKDAKWVRTFGGAGSAKGKMKTPHGLWVDDRPGREPQLVVADRANARLQMFTLGGQHLGFQSDVSFPADIDIRGDVMLVPDLHARVTLLDKDNSLLAHLGYEPAWTKQVLAAGLKMRRTPNKWRAGRFVHPHDACFDRAGNIFVTEWVPTGRVTLLRKLT